jgi:hypothetical protein
MARERWVEELETDPHAFCLPETVKVTLPVKCSGCKEVRGIVKEYMAETFGGYTAHFAKGCWLDDKRNNICEPVEVIESGHVCLTPEKGAEFAQLIKAAGWQMKQDSMALKVDHFTLISKKDYFPEPLTYFED